MLIYLVTFATGGSLGLIVATCILVFLEVLTPDRR